MPERIKTVLYRVLDALLSTRPRRLADLCEPSAPQSLDDLNARSRTNG